MTSRRSLLSESIAGIRLPDSKAAREATDLLREYGTPLLFAHSLRTRHRQLELSWARRAG